MQFETRILFEIVEACEGIENTENEAQTLRMVCLYPLRLTCQEEFLEAFVPKASNHAASLTYIVTQPQRPS